MSSVSFSQLSIGSKFRITNIESDHKLRRRLMSLGIAIGNELELMQLRKGGIVVAKNGNRVALGDGITQFLKVEVVE
ncbi:MAG: ferrous iron transport protein A [Gammaproteobacteria bacterium]|nr:ferrous iron transport protein A [Gammaproteobacteria bacterium]